MFRYLITTFTPTGQYAWKVRLSLYKRIGLQEVEASRIYRHLAFGGGKVVRPMHWPPLPPGDFMELISVRGGVNTSFLVLPEGLSQ